MINISRIAYASLLSWKKDKDRKPLVLKGARQVGKTWLMEEFGKREYENYVLFSFDEDVELASIFERNKNPHRIVELLGLLGGQKIEPAKTLIIFDEIQECSAVLNSLKYFNEKANEYHVIAAGSLLGTLLAEPKSYPVGKVNLLNIYPLTFGEFLKALEPPLYQYYHEVKKGQVIEEIFHNRLIEMVNYYLIIGGLPECVSSWIQHKSPERINQIQKDLINLYEGDITKHNSKVNSGRILLVFRSIVSQLSKGNQKFIYSNISKGARGREYEEAIEWLVSAGIVNRIYNVSKPEHPLKAFEQLDYFKLYFFDTGLLKQMAGLDNQAILLEGNFQFKGVLAENFVLQQLLESSMSIPYFYAEKNAEIDFLIQLGRDVIPVEVKAGESKMATSFKNYIKKKQPACAIRISKRNYVRDGEITNLPLYLVNRLAELV